MAAKSRTPHKDMDVAEKVATAARMYKEGYSQTKICKVLGVSRQSVTYYIAKARAVWREETKDCIGQRIADELEALDRIENEALAAWYRSIGKTVEKTTKDGVDGREVTTKVARQTGDGRFLSIIGNAVEQRRKIFGIDAPTKQEVKDTTEPTKSREDLEQLILNKIEAKRAERERAAGLEAE